jgi:hypothetical protein
MKMKINNLWGTVKAVFRGKPIALNCIFEKNDPESENFHLKELEKNSNKNLKHGEERK